MRTNTIKNFAKRFAALVLVLLTVGVGSMWGAKYSMTPDQASTGSSETTYITTLTSFTYASPAGSKIKWQMNRWNPKTLQIKTNESSASNEFRFYTDSVLPGKITKVVVTFSALTLSNTTTTGFKFVGSSNKVTGTSGGTDGTWNGSAKTLTWTPGSSDNYTYFAMYQNGKVATSSNYLASSDAIVVTYLTKVTLDKNGGTADGVAYFDDNATGASTATNYTFSQATHASKTCTGYYTASSDGTKVLNADGTFAASTVSGYITSNKWTYTGGTLKLYAQWETSLSDRDVLVYDDREQYDTIGYYGTLTSFSLSYMTDGGGDVTWSSTDEDVVTVDDDGEGGATVTVVGAGSADIKATVAEDAEYNEAVGTYEVVILAVAPTLSHNTSGKELETSNLTSTSVRAAGGIVTNKGGASITKYGLILGTSSDVDWETATQKKGSSSDVELNTKFTFADFTGLTPNTPYYVRAFAYNGTEYGYSTAVSFTTLQSYAISYNNNGGSGSMASTTKDHGVDFTLPANAGDMTKTGYHITGWLLGSSSGTHFDVSGTYEGNAAATFYVEWTANTYQVKFDANGGTGSMSNEDFTYGASAKALTTCSFTPPTHKYFTGWNTEEGGGGTSYTNGQSVSNLTTTHEGTVTLYAQWADHTFTNYRTKCCTDLSAIGGTVVFSDPSTAVLTWNTMSNVDATTPYVVTYRTGSDEFDDDNVGSITTNGAGKKTCTITGLSCNTDYDFKIEVTAASGYCDVDTILEDKNSGKWNVDYTMIGVQVKSGTDEGDNACGDFSVTFEPTSGAYTLPSTISVTIGGDDATSGTDYTWDDDSGELTIDDDKVTGAITVTIEGDEVGCLVDPTLGAASLKTGGTFNLGQVDVTVATSSAGDYCEWVDYGFVWGTSANPTVSNNKVQIGTSGTATTWNGSIVASNSTSPTSLSTGTTYYFRAYGKNGKTGAEFVYGTGGTFTPRKVTYNSNGGSDVDAVYVNSGGTVSAPSSPTKTGYTFDSWRTTSDLTTAMNFSGTITKDTTLYAKWTAVSYTVTLKPNTGTGSDQVVSATYDADMPLVTTADGTPAISVPTKSGYTLLGYWDTDESTGGNQYYSYNAGTSTLSSYRTWNKTAATNLYARWQANEYTITLDNQSATSAGTESISVTFDANTNLTGSPAITKPTKTNYRFDGYYTAKDGGGSQVIGADGNVIASVASYTDASKNWIQAGNVTLYAKWTRVYTATWSVNGETSTEQVANGEKVAAMPTAPTKADCDDAKKFIGWTNSEYSDATDAPTLCFTDVSGSPEIDDDVTFYAVFADVVEGSVSWDLVTNASSLQENDIITFTSTCTYNYSATAYYDTVAYAGKNSTLGAAVPIGITSDKIRTVKSGSISEVKLIEGSTSGKWKLYDVTSEKYLNDADKGISYDETGDDATITITDGVATVTIGSYNLQYNPNNNAGDYSKARFAYYSSTQKAIQIYKKTEIKTSITNYVTTCASCDEDATYSNTTPTVSEIDCTTATLTMEGGLATVGSEGCHISDYGFVIGTEDDPEIDGDGVTKLQVGTSDPTTGADFSYDATGLTKGTHYYVRAYATNKHGTAYSSSEDFWTQGVSSIAITKAPTRTKYIAGETFDPTGMVVTATLPSGDTEDVTTDCTFSPDLETALSTLNTSVTVGYSPCSEDLSKTQTINVYSMTVSEGTNASYGSYEYTTGATFSVTPEDGKTYTLAVTNGTAVDNLDGTHTIINPTGDVTVTINYRAATTVKVYYKFDGNTVITQDVTESTTATLPTASDLATAIANNDLELPEGTAYSNFWGWSENQFTPQTDEPTIVNSPTINATKTFYAVYTNMNKIRIDEEVITSGGYPSSEQTVTLSSKDFKYHYICKQTTNLQFQKASSTHGYLYNSSAIGYIRKIEVGASGSNDNVPVYACSAANTISGSALEDENISDYKYVYLFPENTQYFKIKGDNSYTYKVNYIDVLYCSTTPYYMTTFCDDKIGAPTVTATKVSTAANKATVTLSWDAVANATGYKVKWGSVSNDWVDVGTERTYVKENVSTGTTKWFVKAKYNEANYCGANIAKGSTTVNTAYSVTYDANITGDYIGTVPTVSWYEPSLSVTVSTNVLAKSRYHWDGWKPYNASTEAEITVTTGAFTMPSANVTVKGQWAEVLSGDEVYITSAEDITTMSSMDIIVERTTYKSGTMTISNQTGGQGGTFHAVIDGATADASDGLLATVKIEYTPTKANVTESATMTAVIGSESYDFTVYGRSLPADFVIVAKVGAAWTALPADATSAGLQQGYSLTLDDATTPTKSTLAPASAVFHYYAKSAKTTDYIRLAGKDNSKALWGNATTNIKMNAAIGGGYATGDAYEWQLATTDNATYTLHNDNSSRYLGVNSDKKWGTHAAGNTASKVLYFLPVDATVDHIGMTVSSWGEASFTFTTSDDIPSYDHVAVECNGDSKSATMSGSGPYTISIPTMDFEDYSGASLVVQWFDNEDVALAQGAVLLPIFITADNTDFEGYDPDILSATDVHIINKSTLTITTNRSVHDLSIEGGSTLNISTTGGGAAVTFNMNSLYLRGGWNDDYTDYDMPRIYIHPKSTLSKTQNTVNFDISVDSRNYYPFAVPFPVTVSAVDYVNSTLAGASQYGKHYVIKEYDGANRAENGAVDANWKIVEDGTVYGTSSATLQPGKGYILTAVSIPAYGGGVIRFPMSFTNAWTAKGEQATIDEENYKNSVTVTAHTGTAATASKCHAGWNMIANPYMSCYGMYSGDGTASILTGKMVVSDGKVSWDDDGLTYVSVPTHDFSEYIQKEITDDTADSPKDAQLLPGWSFFVQIGTSGTLTFLTANEQADSDLPIYAPKRTAAEQKVVKTGIVLSSETASDKTTFLISDRYSSEYEIGADLEKMFGNGYTLATYSLNNDTRLAFNAMSTAQANELIPIGVRLPEDGEYTFSLNERYADANIERLDLIDYETGEVTDLMATDYIFYATRSQNDERFALNVQRGKQTPTDIGGADIGAPDGARKILLNGTIFIVRDGLLYDATGKRVQTNK